MTFIHRLSDQLTYFSEAFTGLLQLRFRALAAVAGISIGCTSVITLYAIGQNAAAESERIYQNMGLDTFVVYLDWLRYSDSALNSAGLPLAAGDATRARLHLAPLILASRTLHIHHQLLEVDVVGSTPALATALMLTPVSGRRLSHSDRLSRHAVVGSDVAAHLSAVTPDAGGNQKIKIGRYFYTVIGVLPPRDASHGLLPFTQDRSVFIPEGAMSGTGIPRKIQTLVGRSLQEAETLSLAGRTGAALSALPGIRGVEVVSPRKMIHDINQQRKTSQRLYLAVCVITLLVGGTGIINIMMTNVSLRRREIGLRRAVGARRRDIVQLFLTEALCLSVTGALIGALTGSAAAWGFASMSGWRFVWSSPALLTGIASSLSTGLIFGLWPAWTAAQLTPVEALREN